MSEYALHQEKVTVLQGQIKERSGSVCSSRHSTHSNTTRNRHYVSGCNTLDLSSLNQVLSIDVESKIIEVEPMVTMEALFDAAYQYGLMPKVVPEFRTITVGGAVMGAALESSSFRYGQFYDTCLGVEVLLGDGTLLWASPEENSELFYALSGSYGTLGLITRIKISLIKAPASIHLAYHLTHSYEEALALFERLSQTPAIDYLEGVVLSSSSIVVIAGTFSNTAAPLTHLLRPLAPWYIQHVVTQEKKLKSTANSLEDWMPVRDYLFRLDRGAFWMGCYAARWPLWRSWLCFWRLRSSHFASALRHHLSTHTPELSPSWWRRLCLLPFISSSRLYRLWHRLKGPLIDELFVVQDFYVPKERVLSFLTSVTSLAKIFPLWLCPIKGTTSPQFLSPHYRSTPIPTFFNVGIYGHPYHCDGATLTKQLEKMACEHDARKMLYARTHYEEGAFWSIYDAERYRAARHCYQAEGTFLPIYTKVSSR